MKTSLLLVAVLAAAGCSKKENKNEAPAPGAKPTTDPGTPPGATTPGTTAPTPGATPGTAVKLDCDKILPKDLREKYLKGYTIKNAQTGADFLGKCDIEPPEQDPAEAAKGNIVYGGSLDASCHDNVKLGKTATIEALQKEFANMKPIDGIPDSLAHDAGPGWQFNVWDNDSNCSISGLVPKGVDGPALAKEWLGVFPLK